MTTPEAGYTEMEAPPTNYAALVNGYWLSQEHEGAPVVASLRGEMSALATATLYHKWRVERELANQLSTPPKDLTIVMTAGSPWGGGIYPTTSQSMREILVGPYQVPEEDIVVMDTTLNTQAEIGLFMQWARANNQHNLLNICAAHHAATIGSVYRREQRNKVNTVNSVQLLPAELLINQFITPELADLFIERIQNAGFEIGFDFNNNIAAELEARRFVRRLQKSKLSGGYALYEAIKTIGHYLGADPILAKIASNIRGGESTPGDFYFGQKIGFPADEYRLP